MNSLAIFVLALAGICVWSVAFAFVMALFWAADDKRFERCARCGKPLHACDSLKVAGRRYQHVACP